MVEAGLVEDVKVLTKAMKRRYAKAIAVFEAGIWSAKSLDFLLGIMIGSMAGVRNSYPELRQDNENMRKELAKMGLRYADCFCGELSPVSHEFVKRDGSVGVTVGELWHLHGFMRFDEFMRADELHSVLSPLWGKIHGSNVVDVKVFDDVGSVIKYSVKDAVKGYCGDGYENRRLLKSSDWLPDGYRMVTKALTAWALWHGAKWQFDDDLDLFAGEYVACAWDVKRSYMKRWCEGETIVLDDEYITGCYRVKIKREEV